MRHLSVLFLLCLFCISSVTASPTGPQATECSRTSSSNEQFFLCLYSSVLPNTSGARFTVKGLQGVDDVAGTFRDLDGDGVIDASRLFALMGGNLMGSQLFQYQPMVSNGMQMLRLPPTEITGNFTPTIADFVPGVPDNAVLMIPITDDDRIDITLGSGSPIVSFDVPIAATIEPGGGGGGEQPIDINLGLIGPWFDSEIPGQGFLIDVNEDLQFIFVTWYTYAPDGSLQWYTAGGNYQGSSSLELEVLETSNGIFNQETEVVRTVVGTLTISFTDCTNGTVNFNLPGLGFQDMINISRVTPDQICQAIEDGTLVLP